MVDGTDANDTAAALVGAAPLLMYYAWMGNARVRLLAIFCAALIANGLVLLNSRGAFLGVVVGSGVFLLFMILFKVVLGGGPGHGGLQGSGRSGRAAVRSECGVDRREQPELPASRRAVVVNHEHLARRPAPPVAVASP